MISTLAPAHSERRLRERNFGRFDLAKKQEMLRETLRAPPLHASRIAGTRFPDAFDVELYRARYPELAALSAADIYHHYTTTGIAEGRIGNALTTRWEFAALVPDDADALEIGPYSKPTLKSKRTRYFDVLSRAELIKRAGLVGVADPGVPEIHFVSPVGDLSIVDDTFDVVLSSHCIEHQPDLVTHLRHVQRLLRSGGCYFLVIPDKRYCFDHFMPHSNLADVLDAFYAKATRHSLRNVLAHRALTCHNDVIRHWQGDHGLNPEDYTLRVGRALREFEGGDGAYIDVHAWFFTPDSATNSLPPSTRLA